MRYRQMDICTEGLYKDIGHSRTRQDRKAAYIKGIQGQNRTYGGLILEEYKGRNNLTENLPDFTIMKGHKTIGIEHKEWSGLYKLNLKHVWQQVVPKFRDVPDKDPKILYCPQPLEATEPARKVLRAWGIRLVCGFASLLITLGTLFGTADSFTIMPMGRTNVPMSTVHGTTIGVHGDYVDCPEQHMQGRTGANPSLKTRSCTSMGNHAPYPSNTVTAQCLGPR